MNKHRLLSWLIQEAEKRGPDYARGDSRRNLQKDLKELNNRRAVTLPRHLPRAPEKKLAALREHFKDRVTLISRVLSNYHPEQFCFYRVSKLEPEIFDGLQFLADVVPAFQLDFDRVGRTGMSRYLKFNEALLAFAREYWPERKRPQATLLAFLYSGLGMLFL
jgi:hypothetical protein